jgi:hypothetical protein
MIELLKKIAWLKRMVKTKFKASYLNSDIYNHGYNQACDDIANLLK